jgi:hypothetical protein
MGVGFEDELSFLENLAEQEAATGSGDGQMCEPKQQAREKCSSPGAAEPALETASGHLLNESINISPIEASDPQEKKVKMAIDTSAELAFLNELAGCPDTGDTKLETTSYVVPHYSSILHAEALLAPFIANVKCSCLPLTQNDGRLQLAQKRRVQTAT